MLVTVRRDLATSDPRRRQVCHHGRGDVVCVQSPRIPALAGNRVPGCAPAGRGHGAVPGCGWGRRARWCGAPSAVPPAGCLMPGRRRLSACGLSARRIAAPASALAASGDAASPGAWTGNQAMTRCRNLRRVAGLVCGLFPLAGASAGGGARHGAGDGAAGVPWYAGGSSRSSRTGRGGLAVRLPRPACRGHGARVVPVASWCPARVPERDSFHDLGSLVRKIPSV